MDKNTKDCGIIIKKEDSVLFFISRDERFFTHRYIFWGRILKGSEYLLFYKGKEFKNKIEKDSFVIKDNYAEVFSS